MKYNLIADAGSTKIDWVLADREGAVVKRFATGGFNATIASEEQTRTFQAELLGLLENCPAPDMVYYYGAGCATPESCLKVRSALRDATGATGIEVDSDLLGAARGLFGSRPGIACILGTGSNSCLYDGERIRHNIPSLGFILGDEGGGAAIGRQFVKDWLRGGIPTDAKEHLDKLDFHLELKDVLDNVYRSPAPNRYLASFLPVVAELTDTDYCKSLVGDEMENFILNTVKQYPGHSDLPVRFAGSIAARFEGILREVAEKNGVRIDMIVRHPLDGIVRYHSEKTTNHG